MEGGCCPLNTPNGTSTGTALGTSAFDGLVMGEKQYPNGSELIWGDRAFTGLIGGLKVPIWLFLVGEGGALGGIAAGGAAVGG